MANSIEEQMTRILDEYEELTKETVETASRKAARDAVQRLRSSSPKASGSYASGWAMKTSSKGAKGIGNVRGYIVHNKTDYQLTHLLENGHVIRNGRGEYGRAPAHVHIAPVEQATVQEFEENIRRNLSK